jgi:hypothetical protein
MGASQDGVDGAPLRQLLDVTKGVDQTGMGATQQDDGSLACFNEKGLVILQ